MTIKKIITAAVLAVALAAALVLSVSAASKYPAAAVSISGSFKDGGTLTATVTGADGAPGSFAYAWYADGKKIGSGRTLAVKSDYVGKVVKVTAKNTAAGINVYAYDASTFKSSLPVVFIETNSGKAIMSKEVYIGAKMKVVLNSAYKNNTNTYTKGFADIEIRGRGNSTWGQKKAPYKLKLGEKSDMFGMGKSKHWVLLANYFDRSNLRNVLSTDYSASLGLIPCESVFVDLVLNGEYVGLYQFGENVRVEDGRVEIFDWEDFASDAADAIAKAEGLSKAAKSALEDGMTADLSWITTKKYKNYDVSKYVDLSDIDFSGGWLIENDDYYDEFSKFMTKNNVKLMIKSPEFAATNEKLMNEIKSYFQSMENAIYSTTGYNSEGKRWSDYMDVDSFLAFWCVNQAFKNVELLYKSCYMYKDIGGPLTFGPIWDMDWSSGNHINLGGSSGTYNEWKNSESQDREYWYRALYSDPYFITILEDYWWAHRAELDTMLGRVSTLAKTISVSAERDAKRWGYGLTADSEVKRLDEWLRNRAEWMDAQLALREPGIMGKYPKSTDAVSISLSAVMNITNDVPLAAAAPADYAVRGANSIAATVSYKSSAAKVEVYVNGALVKSAATGSKAGRIDIALDKSALVPGSKGRNVIEALAYDKSGKYLGESYIILRVYDASDAAVTLLPGDAGGSAVTGYTAKGATITLPDAPWQSAALTFTGWSDGKKTYAAGDKVKVNGDVSFTAQWKKVPPLAKLSGKPFGTDAWGGSDSTFEKAWDGKIKTFFDPEGVGSKYYTAVDLGAKYTLTKVRIMPRDGFPDRFLGATIYGSNDKKAWTPIWTSSKGLDTPVWQEIIIKGAAAYRYYKYGNDTMHGDVAEIELYGYRAD